MEDLNNYFMLFRINSYLNPINLVTYGKNTAGSNQCWGHYNTTSRIGYGPGYQYACIHSGTIVNSGDLPTNWYNYTLATAGTIIDENTSSSNPATNTTEATESICPKGWTLPSRPQTGTIGPGGGGSATYVLEFSPVLGGNYTNGGILQNENISGTWWSSTAYDGTRRQRLAYNDGNLQTYYNGARYSGYYIRCIQAS